MQAKLGREWFLKGFQPESLKLDIISEHNIYHESLQRWHMDMAEEFPGNIQDHLSVVLVSDIFASDTFTAFHHHLQIVILVDMEDHILAELSEQSVRAFLQLQKKGTKFS